MQQRKKNSHDSLALTLFAVVSIWAMVTILSLLFGCAAVVVPDTEVCSVAGTLASGADCSHTLASPPEVRYMAFEEFLSFMQGTADQGGALCQSAEDWGKQKTALEQACKLLGSRCRYEIKKAGSK